MSGKQKKVSHGMSGTAKWIITLIIFALAIATVLLCYESGSFSFKPGSVQANDEEIPETAAPKETEQPEDETVTHKIFVTAGAGGKASPSGSVTVTDWDSITVSFTPDEGYEISSVVADGVEKGAVSAYTFSYVREEHTLVVRFSRKPEPTPSPGFWEELFGDEDEETGSEPTQFFDE